MHRAAFRIPVILPAPARRLDHTLLATAVLVVLTMALPSLGLAQGVSPLETVMDGRAAAGTSMLTEAGTRTMTQSLVNSAMYVCGALSIVLVAMGLYQLYLTQEAQNMMNTTDDAKRAAYWKIVIGGLISIPAVIAAIVPYNVL